MSTRELRAAAVAALFSVTREVHLCDALTEDIFGFSASQLSALTALRDAESHSVTQLARDLHLHQSSVSTLVKSLQEKDFVTRTCSKADARAFEIRLTEKGRDVVDRAGGHSRPVVAAAMARMSDSSLLQLIESLRALADGLAAQRQKEAS